MRELGLEVARCSSGLPPGGRGGTIAAMHDEELIPAAVPIAARQQYRLELAQKAYREFFVQCFWSYRDDAEITEDKIPFVIRGLREHGGLRGYRIAAELCR